MSKDKAFCFNINYLLSGLLFVIIGWVFILSQTLIAENRQNLHELETKVVTKHDLTGAVKFIRDDIAELRRCCYKSAGK